MCSLYDVLQHADSPQYAVPLRVKPQRRARTIALDDLIDDEDDDVVSFTVRSANWSAGWDDLGVYVVTVTGKVYSVCPFAPRDMYVLCDVLLC